MSLRGQWCLAETAGRAGGRRGGRTPLAAGDPAEQLSFYTQKREADRQHGSSSPPQGHVARLPPQHRGLSPRAVCTQTRPGSPLLPGHGDAMAELQTSVARTPLCPSLPMSFMVAIPKASARPEGSGEHSASDAGLCDHTKHTYRYLSESYNRV